MLPLLTSQASRKLLRAHVLAPCRTLLFRLYLGALRQLKTPSPRSAFSPACNLHTAPTWAASRSTSAPPTCRVPCCPDTSSRRCSCTSPIPPLQLHGIPFQLHRYFRRATDHPRHAWIFLQVWIFPETPHRVEDNLHLRRHCKSHQCRLWPAILRGRRQHPEFLSLQEPQNLREIHDRLLPSFLRFECSLYRACLARFVAVGVITPAKNSRALQIHGAPRFFFDRFSVPCFLRLLTFAQEGSSGSHPFAAALFAEGTSVSVTVAPAARNRTTSMVKSSACRAPRAKFSTDSSTVF